MRRFAIQSTCAALSAAALTTSAPAGAQTLGGSNQGLDAGATALVIGVGVVDLGVNTTFAIADVAYGRSLLPVGWAVPQLLIVGLPQLAIGPALIYDGTTQGDPGGRAALIIWGAGTAALGAWFTGHAIYSLARGHRPRAALLEAPAPRAAVFAPRALAPSPVGRAPGLALSGDFNL